MQDLRKSLGDLRDGLKRIRQELGEHYADLSEQDRYGKQMWAFVNRANVQMEDLIDDVKNAETTFTDAINYYGEEDKNMSSSEFYGIFKTFVTSYRVSCLEPLLDRLFYVADSQKCQTENQTAADEKIASEKRKQALEETKANRQKALEASGVGEDQDVLDALLATLRNGDPVRKSRRRRASVEPNRPAPPLSLNLGGGVIAGGDTADVARDMLARLQSDGFMPMPMPTTPTAPTPQRRRRRRTENRSIGGELLGSPLALEIHHIQEMDDHDAQEYMEQ